MTKRTNLRPQLKPISKPALKFLWMISKRKTPSLSSRRSGMPAGCAVVLTNDEDVLIEILARLPVKTLMRFRCVCKTWKSLIADPHFVKKHIKYDAGRALTDADLRLLFTMKPPSSMALADLKGVKGAEVGERFRDDLVSFRELEFPVSLDFVKGDDIVNVGSCNGIMCIRVRGDYMLWNPCTGEHKVLPKPSVACYSRYYGFGYDDVNDDYKVVKGSRMEIDNDGWVKPMIQVFSLRKGTWMTYPGPKNVNTRDVNMRGQGAFLNGKLHWLWFKDEYEMESSEIWPFSLAEEKFHETIPIPFNSLPHHWNTRIRGIVTCRNCLSVYSDFGAVRILMMKEYGVEESWTEALYLTYHEVPVLYDDICGVKPLWILKNGDVLAFTVQQGGYLSVYKAKDKAFRNFIRPQGSYRFEEVIYRESLVSPITGSPRDI